MGSFKQARFHLMVRAFILASILPTVMACAAATRGAPMTPVIDSIEPRSGPVGVAYPIEIVITGRGFAGEGNTVRFGDVVVTGLSSTANGTRIVFMAPKQRRPSGEAPPMVLQPGRYPITVTTPSGTSAPVDFELVGDV